MLRTAWLALLLLGCTPSARLPDPSPVTPPIASVVVAPAPPQRPDLSGQESFVVVRDGMLFGRTSVEWTPTEAGGLVEKSVLTLEMKKDGVTLRAVTVSTVEYDAELRVVSSSGVTREADATTETHSRRDGAKVVVRLVSPAHTDQYELVIPPGAGSELATFHELRREVLAGASFPRKRSYEALDEDARVFETHTLTLLGRETIEGREGYRFESFDGERKTGGVLDDRGMPIVLEASGLVAAREGLKLAEAKGTASFSSELPLEGALPPATERTVQVLVDGDDPKADPIFVDGPYQRVVREEGRYVLTLSARRATLRDSPALPIPDLPPEVRKYLAATPTAQSEDEAIVALSKKIVGDQRDSRKAARAIATWVYKNLEKTDGVRGAASAVETLVARRGDCTEHTSLVVALARAAGIPARGTGGIVLVAGKKPSAGYHAWPELWLGEWVVLDAALGVLDVSANYLFLEHDEPGDPSSDGLVRMLGKSKIVVPAVTPSKAR